MRSSNCLQSNIATKKNRNKKFCWLIDIYNTTNAAGKKRNHMTKKNMKLWSQPKSM